MNMLAKSLVAAGATALVLGFANVWVAKADTTLSYTPQQYEE
ncbi:hypothetical protein [Alicyclobacillus shizuokensis]|nr:hypothetical protein [Alicyclobacillus shizuokensis]